MDLLFPSLVRSFYIFIYFLVFYEKLFPLKYNTLINLLSLHWTTSGVHNFQGEAGLIPVWFNLLPQMLVVSRSVWAITYIYRSFIMRYSYICSLTYSVVT